VAAGGATSAAAREVTLRAKCERRIGVLLRFIPQTAHLPRTGCRPWRAPHINVEMSRSDRRALLRTGSKRSEPYQNKIILLLPVSITDPNDRRFVDRSYSPPSQIEGRRCLADGGSDRKHGQGGSCSAHVAACGFQGHRLA